MADGLITAEQVAAHVRDHCPDRIEVTTYGSAEPEYLCGCGQCPTPDPTPELLRRRVDEAAWRKAADTDA